MNAPGITIFARKPLARVEDRFMYPLSTRYDELDCGMRMENVFIPWEHVFLYRDVEFFNRFMYRILPWIQYYHLARMLAWADFSLGLALAVTEMQTTANAAESVESVTDLILQTETMRTALHACAANAQSSPAGIALPNMMNLTVGMASALENRARMAHTVRVLAGHQAMLAPSLQDLAAPELGPVIAPSYESDGLSARQRAALLHLVADHTASALEGRQATFEALATGGMRIWRGQAQRFFGRRGELVNGVLATLEEADRPSLTGEAMAPH